MRSRSYQVGRSRITLLFGDITRSEAEVIVSSDDFRLSMGGGVSASILRAGGRRIAVDASKLTPLRVADVAVSTAGHLPAKYLMHAITLGPGADEISRDAVVRQVTQRALRLATELGCSSIAFPAIGSGTARIPFEVVASQMAGALVDFLLDSEATLDVELYFREKHWHEDDRDLFPFFEAFAGSTRGLEMSGGPAGTVLGPPPLLEDAESEEDSAEASRLRQVYEMLRRLDGRRDQLEARLFQALSVEDPSAGQKIARIREQLEEISALRASYARELEHISGAGGGATDDSVFVSSTSADLRQHRAAVRSTVEGLKLRFVGMEGFTPTAQPPAQLICEKVDSAKVYVGILGMRYGSLDETTGLSMTETEYRRALTGGKPVRMFLMNEDAPITMGMVEKDPDLYAKLQTLRSEVMKKHTCGMFSNVEDLAQKVEASLRETFGR